jgi:(p)ppGpp synthase/HD superfamily hydrolase
MIHLGGSLTKDALGLPSRYDLAYQAYLYANFSHGMQRQVRKYTGEPYIVHPVEVASIVLSVAHTQAMVAAAYLHDVVEDTQVELEDIEMFFGVEVAQLVWGLTSPSKPSDGNRATRKAIDRVHIASASPQVKTVKAADIISNVSSIVAHDRAFAEIYIPEKLQVLPLLEGADNALLSRLRLKLESAAMALGDQISGLLHPRHSQSALGSVSGCSL